MWSYFRFSILSIIDTRYNRVVGVEALMRWMRGSQMLSPGKVRNTTGTLPRRHPQASDPAGGEPPKPHDEPMRQRLQVS